MEMRMERMEREGRERGIGKSEGGGWRENEDGEHHVEMDLDKTGEEVRKH
jgi:hypothetical protein